MRDGDEFGDLYTDVLQPFAPFSPSPPKPQPIHRQQSPQQQQRRDAEPANADFDRVNEPSVVDSVDRDVKFDIEDEEIDDDAPLIPGLSGTAEEASRRIDQGDDWDNSDDDSEDDLQIVLDDNSLMAAAEAGDDGGLNIAASDTEEHDWGENSMQPVDGERKDVGESAKVLAPKIGYSNQGYHPFHSQFKYVRPGAASIPAATSSVPGVPPGQIRPLVNMNPVAGHGRGDWRPAGIKGAAAMQKGFQAGPGLPIWGNNAAGRGFGGGLEFTLPSHKTIFDVDIDSFEEKPWKYPGVDVSDFFNFGLNEDTWKDYCKQLEQLRLESTMQSKIHVYERGRTEQDYDPDLPPELAAASGIHYVPVDNANSVKSDVGQNDLRTGSGPVRPPMPTGRAIQVESGYGDRLPSIDTRPSRIRDSDAIIEIVLQDPADDDSSARIDFQDQQEGGEPQREEFSEDHVVGHEIPRSEPEYFNGSPRDYNGQKRELVGRRMPFMKASPTNIPVEDKNLPVPQEEPIDYSDSRHQTPRQMLGRVCDQSPDIACSQEMTIVDNKKEESVESMEGRHSALLSSPAIEDVKESSIENKQLEETGTADGSSKLEKEDIDLNTVDNRDTVKDEVAERQKVTSQVEQPLLGDGSDWEDSKAVRSSDNSKAKSESSRDYHKQWDGFEEIVQDPGSVHLGGIRLQPDENEQVFHRREHDGRQKPERNGMVIKRREDPYPHKDRYPSSAPQSHTKIDRFDSQRDRVSSDMDWACRDDDLYGRRVKNDEPRKRDRGGVRENERSDNDNSFHSRKQLDNCSYRVPYDKDVRSRVLRHKERDDSLKDKHETVEDFLSKRRKNEEYLRRDHVGKEVLHGYRENVSRHKPEKDSVLDPRKRDHHQRSRDNVDDQYAARQKNEAWLLRERGNKKRDREEWHRVKQSHEEHPSKRERGGRGFVRSEQGAEEKTLVGHVRVKGEHKVSEKEYQLKRTDRNKGESPHRKGHDDAYVRGNNIIMRKGDLVRKNQVVMVIVLLLL
ncbi:FIP1of V protein [Spatholobus suberectus]|nr:FIP1of V protein [Spatholobus suberectus]